MRKIDKIIIHCTATYEGREVSIETIDKWHKARGWKGVGYHFLIGLDGTVSYGRDVATIGAHTRGQNGSSLGIAYVGGVDAQKEPKDTMTEKQELSMLELIRGLRIVFGDLALHGHNEYANKACPSFDVQEKYKFLI